MYSFIAIEVIILPLVLCTHCNKELESCWSTTFQGCPFRMMFEAKLISQIQSL